MKRIGIVLSLTLAVLASCQLAPLPEPWTLPEYPGVPYSGGSVGSALSFTRSHLAYVDDPTGPWLPPDVLLAGGQTQCKGFALLAAYLITRDAGLTANVVLGASATGNAHAWIEVFEAGRWTEYEPQWSPPDAPSRYTRSHSAALETALQWAEEGRKE